MPFIERVAHSTSRVTKGVIYAMTDHHIIDDQGNSMSPSFQIKEYWHILPSDEEPTTQPTNSENQMLTIETVTEINKKRVDTYSSETLIRFIQEEEAHIDALNEVRTVSKAVTNLKQRHQTNIKQLVTILDQMEPGDE